MPLIEWSVILQGKRWNTSAEKRPRYKLQRNPGKCPVNRSRRVHCRQWSKAHENKEMPFSYHQIRLYKIYQHPAKDRWGGKCIILNFWWGCELTSFFKMAIWHCVSTDLKLYIYSAPKPSDFAAKVRCSGGNRDCIDEGVGTKIWSALLWTLA